MYRGWPIIKREFIEMARTKAYIIGTLLGPLFIVLLMVGPLLFMRAGGGGERTVLVLDASGTDAGAEVAASLGAAGPEAVDGMGSRFTATVQRVQADDREAMRAARARVGTEGGDALDGFLYLPPAFIESGVPVLYEGRNATSMTQMAQIRQSLNQVARGRRLAEAGVTPEVVMTAMAPVAMEARKPGSDEEEGEGAETAFFLGLIMGMAVYFAVVLFAASVMRGVLEEKRDRIVEVLLSSIRARQLIVGKVLGIGAASLFQMLIWVGFAAAAFIWGPAIAANYGVGFPDVPAIPGGVALVFLFFFATGFLLYAAMFGAAGAIATSDQEANQMQFPVTVPLIIGIFMMYSLMADADSGVAVAGSLIPFTAPVVMPVRAMMTDIPMIEYVTAGALMLVTLVAIMWATAKIYRIGVLSTGKRPSMAELVRWLRTA
jgi:ABC-2 type transport system permease protein